MTGFHGTNITISFLTTLPAPRLKKRYEIRTLEYGGKRSRTNKKKPLPSIPGERFFYSWNHSGLEYGNLRPIPDVRAAVEFGVVDIDTPEMVCLAVIALIGVAPLMDDIVAPVDFPEVHVDVAGAADETDAGLASLDKLVFFFRWESFAETLLHGALNTARKMSSVRF